MCVCITADGSAMKQFIIVDRVTGGQERRSMGHTEDKIHLSFESSAFTTNKLFSEWAEEVFFPEIPRRREFYDYREQAVLLLDRFTCHHTPEFVQKWGLAKVEVVFLVPHTSDRTQPLDLLTFALAKKAYHTCKGEVLSSDQSRQILRMMEAIHAGTSVNKMVTAFLRAGLLLMQEADGQY
jgi:hypothetical protein